LLGLKVEIEKSSAACRRHSSSRYDVPGASIESFGPSARTRRASFVVPRPCYL